MGTASTPQGILIANLGSPSAPTPRAVRRFLDEFLGDPLVVDVNPLVWWLIRKGIILPFRSPKTAALYRSIWTPEGSPIVAITLRQCRALAERLGPAYVVEPAMRYGEPSIRTGLARLLAAGCHDVRVLSMFPQASRTTTETLERAIRAEWATFFAPGDVTFVPPYYDHPAYIAALAANARETAGFDDVDHVLLSFHGLPVRLVEQGDPYQRHCEATARALATALELPDERWTLVYQSRFGREPWLEPDVVDVAQGLAKEGKRIAVMTPGFPTDCLETLEEIGTRLVEQVQEVGGPAPLVVPGLNERVDWTAATEQLLR
jgi:ferrochelatase